MKLLVLEAHAASSRPAKTRPIIETIRMTASRAKGTADRTHGRRAPHWLMADYSFNVRPPGSMPFNVDASMAPSQKKISRPSTNVEKCELARLVAHQQMRAATASWRKGVGDGQVRARKMKNKKAANPISPCSPRILRNWLCGSPVSFPRHPSTPCP